MTSSRFRASYSVLSCWARGDWQDAIRMYFGLPRTVTPQMMDGRLHHTRWQQYIEEHGRLPEVFGGASLSSPLCEVKRVAPVYDWLDLVGAIDCYDRPVIYEFKTGTRSSARYANDYQVEVYGVLATLSGLYVERAEIHRYDQYKQQADMTLVWLTDNALRRGLNWIETTASEMYQYLLDNKLYQRFGKAEITEDSVAALE